MDLLTGTYTNIEYLLSVINETLKNAKHQDIQFSYSRLSSRVSVTVPEGKTCTLKTDLPGLVLGIGEIATKHNITGSYTFPFANDISKGRRFVLLYTNLIGSSVEYEDNEDSRVLKKFLIQTLNGINNNVQNLFFTPPFLLSFFRLVSLVSHHPAFLERLFYKKNSALFLVFCCELFPIVFI